VPQFDNPQETQQMAALVARLQEILQQLVDQAGKIEVVSSAPAVGELLELGDGKGNILSEVKILDDSTQTNRKLYYKYQGNLRLIDSA